jgi:hypothetical protein
MGRAKGWAAAATGRPANVIAGPPSGGARREHRQRFWEAIAKGLSSEDAGVVAGVSPAVGTRWFREGDGMLSVTWVPLSGRSLSFEEREEIARATTAQWHPDRRARRPKVVKLAADEALRRYVRERLSGQVTTTDGQAVAGPDIGWIGRRHGRRQDRRWATSWSPEHIANRLRIDFPDDELMRISHEAIYQALYVQGRGALRRELCACLRTGRALRVPRARTQGRGKRLITSEVMISKCPAEAGDRAVPGHWEGDLILGSGSSAIGTLVERNPLHHAATSAAYARARPGQSQNGPLWPGTAPKPVHDAIASSITTLPEQLRRSLT